MSVERADKGAVKSPQHPSEEVIRTLHDNIPTIIADMCTFATNHDEPRKSDFNRLPREAPVDIPNAMLRSKPNCGDMMKYRTRIL
jgi:hypothetical protein